jgi:hypothetical protein
MLTRENFEKYARNFGEWCRYPAVRYKVSLDFLGVDYNDEKLCGLRREFLKSDIVLELRDTQDYNGTWGKLFSVTDKKPEIKTKFFRNTMTALARCVYIGLRIEDNSDILTLALEHLEDILKDKTYSLLQKYSSGNNERLIPWNLNAVAAMAETISPDNYNSLCDDLFDQWNYIALCAFEDGEYSHERDKKAQHELLGTREERLVPLPLGLLLGRSRALSESLQQAMCGHYGKNAYHNGYFWAVPLDKIKEEPPVWADKYSQRVFPTIDYIKQIKNTREYLDDAVNWLEVSKNQDNLWDFGPQVSFDPWGACRYFSTGKNHKYNRIVNCTMEVLHVFKKYLDNNFII